MSGIARAIGWAWLLAGLIGVLSVLLAHHGVHLPLRPALGEMMAFPWSGFASTMGMAYPLSAVVMAIGIVINAVMLFALANMLDR